MSHPELAEQPHVSPTGPAEEILDAARLHALRESGMLDSPPDVAFDRIARLASRLLNAPVALVSLVDADRQFFKSCIGLPEPWATGRETPLSHSFCQHAVSMRQPLVIEDARVHPLVSDNLAIRDLGVIAYAGIPLITGDGQALGSFCVIDTVPRRWSDAELATLADLAESVVTELELRAALRRAEAARAEAASANRAKDDLLALVSHELRTPLTGIASNAQMLAMGICGPVSERQAQALQRIHRSQEHLSGLINQLLDYKKLAAGHMSYVLAPVSARDALDDAATFFESQVEQAGLQLTRILPAEGVAVRADADKLRQILVNLIANAVKYTLRGGSVTLAGDADAGWVRFSVRDTGIGIPDDQLAAVFEPFVQVRDGRKPTSAGTGLGLAISRDLARGMGGDVTAESAMGRGSTFTLALPRA